MSTARGMVVCPQREAAEVAARVLRDGGNAMDAAVSGAMAQGVVDPLMCGIGGYGVMLVHDGASGANHVVDFFSHAPGNVEEGAAGGRLVREFAYDYGYVVEDGSNEIGYQSVGLPGTVAGLALGLRRFGSISWADALEPAARLAEQGVLVTPAMRDHWMQPAGPDKPATVDRLRATEGARRIFLKGDGLYAAGERLPTGDHGATLRRLMAAGPEDFYRGGIAAEIARDFGANGGLIDATDLDRYEARLREPLTTTYRDREIVAPPYPSGGVSVLEALNLLELEADGGDGDWPSVPAAHALATALSLAVRDKLLRLAGSRDAELPLDTLVGKAYAGRMHGTVTPGGFGSELHEAADTTHLSAVDGDGNAVAITHTLASASGVVTPGLGFVFNDFMHGFDPRGGRWNSLRPGGTRPASICPTFVFERDGRLRSVVGATGSTRIVTSLVQVLSHLLDRGWEPVRSVCAPRFNVQVDGRIQTEGRFPDGVVEGLAGAGWSVQRRARNYDGYFGRAYVLDRSAPEGPWEGAADPRNDGGMVLTP